MDGEIDARKGHAGNSGIAAQSLFQRASCRVDGSALAVNFQQQAGLLSEQPADFAAFAFDSRDGHVVVGGRAVPHPRDDRRFGTLLDRDPFRSGHRSASYGGRMLRNGDSDLSCQVLVPLVEIEKCKNRVGKLVDVFVLSLLPTFGGGRNSLAVSWIRSFCLKLFGYGIDGGAIGPHTKADRSSALRRFYGPRGPGCFDSASHSRVARFEQLPRLGDVQFLPVFRDDDTMVWRGPDDTSLVGHQV